MAIRVHQHHIAQRKGVQLRVRRKSQSTRQPAGSGIGHEHASEGNDAAAKERRKLELALAVLMKAKCWNGAQREACWHLQPMRIRRREQFVRFS